MMKLLTENDIRYICHFMMGVDWVPSFVEFPNWRDHQKEIANRDAILQILSKCDSKLEIMYFLGIGYYLAMNGRSEGYPAMWTDDYQGQKGIHVSEPFVGGRYGNGLSSMLVIPQYLSSEKPIHHDFGICSGESNGGGPWHFMAAVEIEGYGVHKSRRRADETRYSGLSYKVYSIQEETSEPQDWFQLFDNDGVPEEWLGNNLVEPLDLETAFKGDLSPDIKALFGED